MALTLLQIVQAATGEMGIAVPSTVVGNASQDPTQLLYLANGLLRDLVREKEWQALTVEYRFSAVYYTYTGNLTDGSATVASMSSTTGLTTTPTYFMPVGTGILQDTYLTAAGGGTVTLSNAANASGTAVSITFSQTKYVLPTGFDRLINNTDWDKSKHWQMLGPETAQQWQWLKSGYISTGPRIRFRVLGGFFQIWPPMGTDDQLGFEYVSNLGVLAAADVVTPSKASFTVDTDTCIWPDQLMVQGLKHRYFKAKGFGDDYLADYQRELSIAKGNDAGAPTLSMAPQLSRTLMDWSQIPDSNFGS